jgi:alpha-mannosidase
VNFKLGSMADGKKNAITANGQSITTPSDCQTAYILAASTAPTDAFNSQISQWDGYFGQWDNRLWNSDLDSDFTNYGDWQGLVPGYTRQGEVAWFCNHKHDPKAGNEFYQYSYLFIAKVAANGSVQLPSDPHVKILAITAVKNEHDDAVPGAPMMDTLADHGGTGSPTITVSGNPNDFQTVTIAPPLYWHKGGIRVSMDDNDLATAGPYGAPFTISRPMTLRAAEVDEAGNVGPVAIYNVTMKDTTAPSIVSASAVKSLGVARIVFSEPIDMISAARTTNYVLSSGAKVDSATVLRDGKTVELALRDALPSGQQETVTVSGIKDFAPRENITMNAKATLEERGAVFMNDEEHHASAEFKPDNMPVKGTDPWTINFFCKPDSMPEPLTLIAGFGRSTDGVVGTARYFANFTKGINFWVCDRDVLTNVPLDVNKWQMLTATFDGKTIRLYKNGEKIAEEGDILVDDLPQVEIMPVDAWDKKRIFPGSVRSFSLWNDALPDIAIQKLWAAGKS